MPEEPEKKIGSSFGESKVLTKRNPGWANLRPAKKGEVRNPHGRPKAGGCINDIIREEGQWPAPPKIITELAKWVPRKQLVGLTQYRAMVLRAWVDAQRGDGNARDFLVNRTEGKAMPMEALKDDRTVIIVGDPEIKAEDKM